MATLEWAQVREADLPDLQRLATAVVRWDGGLPDMAEEAALRATYVDNPSIGGRDDLGELVAVAAVAPGPGGTRTATALVHPSVRGQGVDAQVVRWCEERSAGHRVVVALDTVPPQAESVLSEAGFHRVFGETVMRHGLRHIPVVRRPEGLVVLPFTEDTASAFHHAFERSFAERPGFEHVDRQHWVASLEAEGDFRPELSRVAFDAAGRAVGFVILSGAWIEQVGVDPTWRGKGLGAHLVARSLTALQRAGADRVWLAVASDNPSRVLYERLGFRARGTRARYERRSDDR